jgi:hypothetical protein
VVWECKLSEKDKRFKTKDKRQKSQDKSGEMLIGGGLKWDKDKLNYEVQEGNYFSGTDHDAPVS